ncbi:MAG: VTT domain-containing protein [Microthrixaceae bacterium]|nr:VTT domain-containing protein [Microthrixaceae bacterium]MCO5314457.1 VTT domain-containing protein [Microthrixaceae bacterium]
MTLAVMTLLAAIPGLPEQLDPKWLIQNGGPWLLFAIIFAESGLLIGFFLPGDSLLFTAGAVAAGVFTDWGVEFNIYMIVIGCFIAAVTGDQVGYLIGNKAGPKLFNRPDSRLFKQEYVNKGTEFFQKYGGRAIVLARFVPIVRTFVPTIAGVSNMHYVDFLKYNVVGGLLWAVGVTMLGYFFGQISFVNENIEIALILIVFISILPILFEFQKARKEKRAEAAEA